MDERRPALARDHLASRLPVKGGRFSPRAPDVKVSKLAPAVNYEEKVEAHPSAGRPLLEEADKT